MYFKMTQLELDPQFVQALRMLHSANKESPEQLRTILDEAIRQRHGSIKMLCNVLPKKYTVEEPVLSDHSSGSSKKSKSSGSSKHSKSSKNSSPVNIQQDTPPDMLQSDDNLAMEILEDDLTCVICKGMDVGARNRLVECVECHSLYHQECHTPHILDSQIDVPRVVWYCSNCSKVQPVQKDRSSPKIVSESSKSKESKKSSSSKHGDKYKSSSSSSSSQAVNGGGSSGSSKSGASINIGAADRRLKDMLKKAKQEKRSGSSSSSGSKHLSSSSSSSSKSSHEKSLSYKAKSTTE